MTPAGAKSCANVSWSKERRGLTDPNATLTILRLSDRSTPVTGRSPSSSAKSEFVWTRHSRISSGDVDEIPTERPLSKIRPRALDPKLSSRQRRTGRSSARFLTTPSRTLRRDPSGGQYPRGVGSRREPVVLGLSGFIPTLSENQRNMTRVSTDIVNFSQQRCRLIQSWAA